MAAGLALSRVLKTSLQRPNGFCQSQLHIQLANSRLASTNSGSSKKFFAFEDSWKFLKKHFNEKLEMIAEIFTLQFNVYAAQRLRRSGQILQLYRRIYSEKSFRHIFSVLLHNLRQKQPQKFGMLLGLSMFFWEKERITEEELKRCIYEFDSLKMNAEDNPNNSNLSCTAHCKANEQEWELVIAKEKVTVWRKPVPKSYLYEYKMYGSFLDIPPKAFFSVQMDLEYRKQWDKLVIELEIIDQAENCEVIHWIMHYPFPMYSREYVYVRRAMVDVKNNVIVLVSRAVDHPSCPDTNKYVRVSQYHSEMVIRPHKNFEENGFDYMLTYFDDPQAAFPSAAYNWMARSGVPDFVEKLHSAAYSLHHQGKPKAPLAEINPSNTNASGTGVSCVYA